MKGSGLVAWEHDRDPKHPLQAASGSFRLPKRQGCFYGGSESLFLGLLRGSYPSSFFAFSGRKI